MTLLTRFCDGAAVEMTATFKLNSPEPVTGYSAGDLLALGAVTVSIGFTAPCDYISRPVVSITWVQ